MRESGNPACHPRYDFRFDEAVGVRSREPLYHAMGSTSSSSAFSQAPTVRIDLRRPCQSESSRQRFRSSQPEVFHG